MDNIFLNEYRCSCGKLLLKGVFFDANLEIKCKKCGSMSNIENTYSSEDSSHYYLTINRDGIFTNVSKSACSILGYQCDEIIGKHFTLIDPTVSNEFSEKFFSSVALRNGEVFFQIETNHIAKNGESIPVRIFMRVQKINNMEKRVLLVAELKNVSLEEKNIQDDNFKFKKNTCDFYFNLDESAVIICASPSFDSIFGIPQLDIIGKSYFDFMSESLRNQAKDNFKYFSKLREPYKLENSKVNLTNNRMVFCEMYFSPKLNYKGKFIGYFVSGWVKPMKKE